MNTARKTALATRVIAIKAIIDQLGAPALGDRDDADLFEALEAALSEIARIANPEGV